MSDSPDSAGVQHKCGIEQQQSYERIPLLSHDRSKMFVDPAILENERLLHLPRSAARAMLDLWELAFSSESSRIAIHSCCIL